MYKNEPRFRDAIMPDVVTDGTKRYEVPEKWLPANIVRWYLLLPPILLIACHTHTFRCENPVPCRADGLLGDAHDAAHVLVVHTIS